jgi:hypothetical protein
MTASEAKFANPTPEQIAKAVRLGASVEVIRGENGSVEELRLLWPAGCERYVPDSLKTAF